MNSRNFLSCVIILVLTATTISYAQQNLAHPNMQKLKIGFAIPLSGNGAWLGKAFQNGVELYFEGHPEFKGQTELFYQDETTANTAMGIKAVAHLIENSKVDALVVLLSPVAFAAGPMIETAKIPTIAIAGAEVSKDRQYMVKLWLATSAEGRSIAVELKKHPEWKTIAFITSEQESMLARSKATKEAFSNNNVDINIVFDENIADTESFGILAAKIAQKKPDVLVLNLMPGQVGLMARKLWQYNYRGQLIGCSTMSAKSELDLAQGSLKGALYVDGDYDYGFIETYRRKYGEFPLPGTANAYDALKILEHALKASGEINHEKLNQNIRLQNFSGALGNYSFIPNNLNSYDLPAILRKID
ncbi:MAG: ABC transporter substrate-binding protein [Deltaproteobacteria bacterium]|nr:ABC transporter substrate-binding protein [Deltaproteobacteria bacterium]